MNREKPEKNVEGQGKNQAQEDALIYKMNSQGEVGGDRRALEFWLAGSLRV